MTGTSGTSSGPVRDTLCGTRTVNATATADPDVAPLLRQMIGEYSGWHLIHRDPGRFEAPNAIDRLDEVNAPTLNSLALQFLRRVHSTH